MWNRVIKKDEADTKDMEDFVVFISVRAATKNRQRWKFRANSVAVV